MGLLTQGAHREQRIFSAGLRRLGRQVLIVNQVDGRAVVGHQQSIWLWPAVALGWVTTRSNTAREAVLVMMHSLQQPILAGRSVLAKPAFQDSLTALWMELGAVYPFAWAWSSDSCLKSDCTQKLLLLGMSFFSPSKCKCSWSWSWSNTEWIELTTATIVVSNWCVVETKLINLVVYGIDFYRLKFSAQEKQWC